MPRPVIFRGAALRDASEAFDYYEDKRPGLGHEFLQELDQALARMQRSPETPRVIRANARRIRLDRFPYWLIYVATPEKLRIVSVFHCSRDPSVWQRRRLR